MYWLPCATVIGVGAVERDHRTRLIGDDQRTCGAGLVIGRVRGGVEDLVGAQLTGIDMAAVDGDDYIAIHRVQGRCFLLRVLAAVRHGDWVGTVERDHRTRLIGDDQRTCGAGLVIGRVGGGVEDLVGAQLTGIDMAAVDGDDYIAIHRVQGRCFFVRVLAAVRYGDWVGCR